MKILAITHQLDRSGAPIALFNLLDILSEYGGEVSLMSLKDGDLATEAKEKGFSLKIRGKFLGDFENFKKEAAGFDIVIVNTLASFDAIHALSRMEIPVIWWIHEGRQIFEFLKDVLPDFKELPANIKPFAVSSKVQGLAEEIMGVYVPVLPLPMKDIPRKSPVSHSDKVRFLTIGTYSTVKGQDILCKAIRGLSEDKRKRAEFLFCGSEETYDEEVFSDVKKLSEEFENVKVLGSLPHDEVLEKLEEVESLLAPSRLDMLPTVGLEAMMKEALCVLSDACGLSKNIRDGVSGFVVPSENPTALRKRIEDIIDNIRDYGKIRKAGREVFKDEFSADSLIPSLLALVNNLTSGRNRLIIFVGVYDTLDIFAYRLDKAFKAMGYETFIFNSKDMQGSLGQLGPFVDKGVKAVITLNNLGYNMELREGSIIWDDLNIPVINILMDHPFCYKDALDNSPKSSIVLSPDFNHMNYTGRFFKKVAVTGFLAHAGIEIPGPKKKLKDRKYDVMYAGGISRTFAANITPDWDKYDFDAKKMCDEVIEDLINNPQKTSEQALEEAITALGLNPSEEELSQFITDFHIVDLYAVSHFREAVVAAVARSGLNLELYGFGWEACDWINLPNVHFHGRIPAEEVLPKMLESKVVLSTMTWFKEGTHDRVFNGMLAGALTVSDESGYMNKEFVGRVDEDGSDNREMVLFSLGEVEKVPEMIRELLADSDRAQAIADRGYIKAKRDHTWDNRAWEIEEDILSQL